VIGGGACTDYSSDSVSSPKGNSSAPNNGVPPVTETEASSEGVGIEGTSSQGQLQVEQAPQQPDQQTAGATAASQPEAAEEPDLLGSLQADLAKTRDQLLRTAADFDNYRKRSRREIADSDRQGRETVLRELLPVFDNLERAVAHADAATDAKSVADGVRLVIQQFLDTIARIGVERLQTLGQSFDPSVHDAIQNVETTEFPPGTVAAEVLPGYKMGDRLVRPAMVVVAKRPAEASVPPSPGNGGSATAEPLPETPKDGQP
jgi:molecular chaperone GrpE